MISTGDLPIHTTFSISVSGDAGVSLYEGTVVSSMGTEVNLVNHKRTGTVHSIGAKTYHSPSVDSKGTVLSDDEYIPGGNKQNNFFGGSSEKREEWILAPNTNYLVEIVNDSSSDIEAGIVMATYENLNMIT